MTTETRVVVFTGSESRHSFMRMVVAADARLKVLRTYCEGTEQSLASRIDAADPDMHDQSRYVAERTHSEEEFFGPANRPSMDRSNPVFIPKGAINDPAIQQEIVALRPDVICAYGCSLVGGILPDAFAGRFFNLHLGLSPYYRGSGTNYFPLVEGRPEFVGATFMFLDRGIDTGKIIHQIRARIFADDTPHSLGHRLIADAVRSYPGLLARRDEIVPVVDSQSSGKLYRRKDFTPESLRIMRRRFAEGMLEDYLRDKAARDAAAPLTRQPWLGEVER